MKWNMKKEALNIGSIQLDNFQLDNDYMEVLLDIVDMSEELRAEINKISKGIIVYGVISR